MRTSSSLRVSSLKIFPRHLLGSTTLLATSLMVAPFAASQAHSSTFKKLYDFCSQPNCADGTRPVGKLLRDEKGNVYGITMGGGDNSAGTIYELVKARGAYQYKRLYSFCAQANCADGGAPLFGVIRDVDGNLYGTTNIGGSADTGIVYRLSKKGRLKVLYETCREMNCTDGGSPGALTYTGAVLGTPYDETSIFLVLITMAASTIAASSSG